MLNGVIRRLSVLASCVVDVGERNGTLKHSARNPVPRWFSLRPRDWNRRDYPDDRSRNSRHRKTQEEVYNMFKESDFALVHGWMVYDRYSGEPEGDPEYTMTISKNQVAFITE